MPPAARQGDMTAHGGAIVAGFPTVMIEGMPAARQGDMHVCPMVNPGTPPPPHVGGPVAMGSTTVMIGGMPAARMGDMCVCSGPPDTIAMGAMTVMIGDAAGGGGGGGGGGRAAGAQAAKYSAAAAESLTPEETTLQKPFMAAQMTDGAQKSAASKAYQASGPGEWEQASFLPGNGQVRRSRLPKESKSEVGARALYGAAWSVEEADVGEEVTITAKAVGVEDGTQAMITIQQVTDEGLSDVEVLPPTEVSGGEIEATWTYKYKDNQGNVTQIGEKVGSGPAVFVAEILITGYPKTAQTPSLAYVRDLEAEYYHPATDEPISNASYRIVFSSGELRKGKTDQNGVISEKSVPPVPYEVFFE